MMRHAIIAILLVASLLTWFFVSHGSNRPDSALRDAPTNEPRQTRIADASSADVRRSRSEEAPGETPTEDEAYSAPSPKPFTIDGRTLDDDESRLLRLMKAFMAKADLSSAFPAEMTPHSWAALSGVFEARLHERTLLADERRGLLVKLGSAKFDRGQYTIEDNTPKWEQDGSHLAMSSFEDPFTGRRRYKVVRVMPGESPEGDWLHERIEGMDRDIAYVVRSFLDRL